MKALILFFSILFLIIANTISGQNNLIKGRFNYKLGYASFPKEYPYNPRIPNLRLQADYGLLKYLEVGIYAGYSRFHCYNLEGGGDYGRPANTLYYGANMNFNPLAFIIKASDFRFDWYITAKYGGHYKFIPEHYSLPRYMPEYNVGVGAAFYIWKHLGFFTEYSFGNFDYFTTVHSSSQHPTPPTMLRFGLTYKYKRK